jgi:hypothetical protein
MAIYSNRIVISIGKTGARSLNITNSQSIPAQEGLQVMLQVSVITLQTYFPWLNSNLSNLRFVYNGQFVPAWLESINNGTATIWIKMPVSIPANSSITLNLYSNSTFNFDGVYWGEAPQLSPTYAEYDNGASVFNFYDNFAGTTLSSKWASGTSGGSYTINNGLTITLPYNAATGSYVYVSTSSYTITSAQIVESYANLNSFNTANFRIVPVALTQYNNASWHGDNEENENAVGWVGNAQSYNTVSAETTTSSATNHFETSQITSTSVYQLWGVIYPNTGSVSVQYNYNNWGSTTTYVPATPLYITISNYVNPSQIFSATTYPINVYYIRARAYPPNGVMPTVELI